jgi:hypothetical protein
MTDTTTDNNNIAIYQSDTGAISLRADCSSDTIWATQKQMAELFDIERSVITKHVKHVLNSEELIENSVCANFAHTAEDGKTYNTKHYNLDTAKVIFNPSQQVLHFRLISS